MNVFFSLQTPEHNTTQQERKKNNLPIIQFKLFMYPIKTNIQNVLLQPTGRQIFPTKYLQQFEHMAHVTTQSLLKL